MEKHKDVESLQAKIQHLLKEKPDVCDGDSPFFVGDMETVRRQYMIWKSLLPRVEIFYAMKCLNEPRVLEQMSELGASYDCASKKEIEAVLNLGVNSSRIIFANTIKSTTSLLFALDNNVSLMTFDNEEELDKIKTCYPQAQLVLRIRCKQSSQVVWNFGLKFGCSLEDVHSMLQKAKYLQLAVVGVSFHVGSWVSDPIVYETAIKDAHAAFEIGKREGFGFHLLDIGGGFLGHDDPNVTFEEVAETLNSCLDQYFPQDSGVRIIAEPGRFLVTSAYTLVLQVIGKRSNVAMEEGFVYENGRMKTARPRFVYYVNDGMYGSVSMELSDLPPMKILCTDNADPNVTYPSVVFGPTCCSRDVLYPDVSLPELYIGDWLYLENAGAYTLVLATDFNNMPRPQCYYL